MNTQRSNLRYELDYSKLDRAEIVTHLNRLLSSQHLFFHKLRNFSWNVVGQDYFELNKKFRDLSNKSLMRSDEVATRIRIFNQTPASSIKEYTQLSMIKESGQSLVGFEMVKEVLADIIILLEQAGECLSTARELGDHGTEIMLKEMIYHLEKDHRELLSWIR